jgi:hypothetical protein
MLIEIMGDAGCRVAELVADDLDVDTALQRDRRRRVPGVVEPHDRQPVVTGQPLKAERHLVRRNWRAVLASEHEIVVVVRAERRQPFFRLATPDNEMNPSMLRRWYRDVSIMNTGRVVLWTLRGQGRIFDIINPYVRATWATKLREVRCAVLILDCLTPALGSLGLTESNEDENQFLIAFDALLIEAGVAEALIAHHMGHVEERPARRRWATSSRRPNAQARSGSSVSDEVRRIITSSPRSPKWFHQFQVIPHDSRIAGSVLIP